MNLQLVLEFLADFPECGIQIHCGERYKFRYQIPNVELRYIIE